MSRVDEAVRRAALHRDARADGLGAAGDILDDPAELAREPFPIELPADRRAKRVHKVERPAAAPVRAAEHVAAAPASQPDRAPLSLIERIDGTFAEKIVVDHKIIPASREQYRRFAATLHYAQTANGLKVVMITSAAPGEGKTLTAANLALTFSESYKRSVLLVDADLRRPTLHALFRVDNSTGLSDGLAAVAERKVAIRQLSERLALLPAGQPSSDPMAGLTSERMRRLTDEAREVFDWVIIDTPPVGLLPDANLLASFADGTVMVVKAGATPYNLVSRAVDAIGRERIVGVVLNRAQLGANGSGYGYGYYDYRHGA